MKQKQHSEMVISLDKIVKQKLNKKQHIVFVLYRIVSTHKTNGAKL